MKDHQGDFKRVLLLSNCGVKEACSGYSLSAKQGFIYVGGHPMAGIEFSGFEHSQENLFRYASMILTPQTDMSIQDMDLLKKLWISLGFNHVQISTPAEHDTIIAFTSQLPHVLSSAYIKSPSSSKHKGYFGNIKI